MVQVSDAVETNDTSKRRRRQKKRVAKTADDVDAARNDITVSANSNQHDDAETVEVELETKSADDENSDRDAKRSDVQQEPGVGASKQSAATSSTADAVTPSGAPVDVPPMSPVSQRDDIDEAPKSLPRQALALVLDNKCYIITIVVLIVIALLLGFFAFDLPNIAQYGPKGDYTNSFRLRLRVSSTLPQTPSSSWSVNITSLIYDPAKPLDFSFRMIDISSTPVMLPRTTTFATPTFDSSTATAALTELLTTTTSDETTLTTAVSATQQPLSSPSSSNSTTLSISYVATYDVVIRILSKSNISAADVGMRYNNFSEFNRANSNNTFVLFSAPVMLTASTFKPPTVVFRPYAAWLTLFTIVGILSLLLKEDTLSPDAVLMLALTILTLAQVITVKESLAGFANEGIATIGALYMVALAIGNSGALDIVSRYVLRSPSSITWALVRLMIPCAILSAFINNTPIVAMMMPVVLEWASTVGVAPSKLLIPLSYAALLGGVVTLIGTSTNLVVKALIQAKENDFDMPLFEMAIVGGPTCVFGLLYMIFIGHRILPSRESVDQKFRKDPRAYTAHVVVRQKSALAGKTIAEAGLRQLKGLFVYEVYRPTTGETFAAPSSEFKLKSEDVLAVAGDVTQVDALFKVDGLQMHAEEDVHKVAKKRGDNHHLVEVVVARGCDLIGRTPREFRFRSVFNAAIVAIHRHGEQIATRIGDVRLHAGDTLLLVTDSDFAAIHRGARQFALISEVGRSNVRGKVALWKILIVSAIAIAVIVISSIDSLGQSLFTMSVLASYIFWLLGIITVDDARNSVAISVMVMVAAAIGLSAAMDNSGLANRMGAALVSLFGTSELGLLFGVYVGTTILNAFVSNSAAVSLTFPIAYEIAKQSAANGGQITVRMIAYLIMMAGSADFSTPIGYQTNLMVYSVGGYRFFDYTKVGLPLQLCVMVSSVLICYYGYRY